MSAVLLAVGDAVAASRSIHRILERYRREPELTVVVLHVHQTASDRLGAYHVEAEPAGACLAETVTTVLQQQGVSATTLVLERREGRLAETIAEVAEDIGADMVVVGAVPGWCHPEVATAAHVAALVGARTTVQTVS
jgi:nucleotide-binding universal stress UspA family protein